MPNSQAPLTNKPVIAGIVDFVFGTALIVTGIVFLLRLRNEILGGAFGWPFLVMGATALLGGYWAIRRQHYRGALICAIISLMAWWGFVPFFLIITSNNEFKS